MERPDPVVCNPAREAKRFGRLSVLRARPVIPSSIPSQPIYSKVPMTSRCPGIGRLRGVRTTMIYAHVLNCSLSDVRSPTDGFEESERVLCRSA